MTARWTRNPIAEFSQDVAPCPPGSGMGAQLMETNPQEVKG
jgi:hypothetical protein